MTKSLAVVTALFAAVLSAAPAFAQATLPAECQPMLAAGEKQFTVPSHAVMTTTGMGPAPMTSEVVNIEGIDQQADGGTHVANTTEVGRVRIAGSENKGKGNKRLVIVLE